MMGDESGLQPTLKVELEKVLDQTIPEESKECAGNMTMSELQLHTDSQLGPKQEPAPLNESTKQSELVIVEDPNNPAGNTGK